MSGDMREPIVTIGASASVVHPPVDQMTAAERLHLGIGESE